MNRSIKGISLVEILIGVSLFVLVWVFLVGSIIIGKASEVRSRHKIQAAYANQKRIEWLREQPFSSIQNSTYANETIDTKGTSTASDDLMGTQTVTVTNFPAGLGPYYKKVIVNTTWRERLPFRGTITASEAIGTYIACDPQVN